MKIIAVLLLVVLAGCASPLAGVRASVEEATAVYDREKVGVEDSYRKAQLDCLSRVPPDACVAEARVAWKPLNDALAAFYKALVAARLAVKIASAGEALGRTPDLARLLALAATAVAAGERFAAELLKLDQPAGAR